MLTFSLNSKSDEPMYHQIYSYIKEEIMAGRLTRDQKLPSARELAEYLAVSRNPVDTAYEQLIAEGYVYSRPKSGYFVNRITYTQQFTGGQNEEEREEPEKDPVWKYDFNPDAVDVKSFPYSVWRSIGRKVLSEKELFMAGDYRGDFILRKAVADYLHGSRGVICKSRNVIIGAGIGYLLQLLAVMFRGERKIVFEEPGYVRAKDILSSNGFKIINIPVKDGGIDTVMLEDIQTNLCYVTPSHQFPLGTVMSIDRRQQLLKWAHEKAERYIIEDDHDSEYRYRGKPIPALQSIDAGGKVIYIGTFSKSISPALRMGYMVLPDHLVERFQTVCGGYNCPVSRLDQAIVADFINEGYFEKHLNRMRKKYKEKHDAVIHILQKYNDKVTVTGDYAGLYVIARLLKKCDEKRILERAARYGINLRPVSAYYEHIPADHIPAFLIGFSNQEIRELQEGLEILCRNVF